METQEMDFNTLEKTEPNYSVSRHVFGFKNIFVNVYMVGNPIPGGKWVLIDAGLPGSAKKIKAEAEKLFGVGTKPETIILTHGHFDHTGALKDLLKEWDVTVYAHPLELPYLTGLSNYPPPDPGVGGGAMAYMSWMFPISASNLGNRVQPIPADGRVPYMEDWRWIHTPGHAPGHISLFRESDRTLLAGDAFVTVNQNSLTDVISQKQELNGPPAYFTIDWEAAENSVRILTSLNPASAGTGHGVPMHGEELQNQLRNLAENFKTPKFGRYVKKPAVTNEQGIVDMPLPISYNLPRFMVGIGLGAIAGAAILGLYNTRKDSSKKDHKKNKIAL